MLAKFLLKSCLNIRKNAKIPHIVISGRFLTSAVLASKDNSCAESIYIQNNGIEWPENLKQSVESDCILVRDFISEQEEGCLLSEVEPRFKRLPYEESHWDEAIHLYRETERSNWSLENREILDRLRRHSFREQAHHLTHVHVLDLHKDGHIKPHIDSERYCGDIISGLSLLSDSVMRLRHKDNDSLIVDLLLSRRSLYILRGLCRYDFKHEVLAENESKFRGEKVPRERRISIICRNYPKRNKTSSNDTLATPFYTGSFSP